MTFFSRVIKIKKKKLFKKQNLCEFNIYIWNKNGDFNAKYPIPEPKKYDHDQPLSIYNRIFYKNNKNY